MHSGVLVLLISSVWGVTESAVSPDKLQDAATSFSLDLFKELAKGEPRNLIVSPVSVSAVLAMLMQGAKGGTAKVLEAALRLDASQAKEAYGELSKHYQENSSLKNTTLEFANQLFLAKSFPVNPEFKNVLTESFLSGVDQVDFQTGEASRIINAWASKATHGKIMTLVDELPPDTALVLANAIFFQAAWDKQFVRSSTSDQDFHVKPGQSVKVPFMSDTRVLATSDHDNLNAVSVLLPFEGKQLSLLVVLPNEKDGLADLVSKLTLSDVSEMISTYTNKRTEIHMPRFKLESKHELKEHLQQLGLEELFRNTDLSGISSSGSSLAVTEVLQKATIEIDEKGGVAAAVTGAVVAPVSAFYPNLLFVVDHPFLAMIVDHQKKIPLFVTTVVNPSLSQ